MLFCFHLHEEIILLMQYIKRLFSKRLLLLGHFFHSLHWQVDWRARCETPAGAACQLPDILPERHATRNKLRLFCLEHPGAEINPFQEQQSLRKQPIKKSGGKGNEKWSVICVARTQGSYTFWVARLNICLNADCEIERRERYVFGFRQVSLVF
jgi:hypothetical protein